MDMNKKLDVDYMLKSALRRTNTPPAELLEKISHIAIKEKRAVHGIYRRSKIALFAAVAVVMLLGFGTVAFAANIFGLRDLVVISGVPSELASAFPDDERDTLKTMFMQGFANSPEHAAFTEWQEFRDSYDISAALEIHGDEPIENIPFIYLFYGAFTPELANALYEIAARHGLYFLGDMWEPNSPREFEERISYGPLFTDPEIQFTGTVFGCGTFWADSIHNVIATGYPNFQFRSSRKGVFHHVFMIVDLANYTYWSYTNVFGQQLLLGQDFQRSLIIYESETAFNVVSILLGSEGQTWVDGRTADFDRTELERFSDMIDFSQLRSEVSNPTGPTPIDIP